MCPWLASRVCPTGFSSSFLILYLVLKKLELKELEHKTKSVLWEIDRPDLV